METNLTREERERKVAKNIAIAASIAAALAAILAYKPEIPRNVTGYLKKLKDQYNNSGKKKDKEVI